MPLLIMRFVNGSDFISKAIDWETNSLFDHVEMLGRTGLWLGAHSDGGFQARAYDYCKPSFEHRYGIPVNDAPYAAIQDKAESMIGIPYDFWGVAGLLLRDRKMTTHGRKFCSMAMMEATMAGGLETTMLNVLPGFTHLITPEELHLSKMLIGCMIPNTQTS